MGLCRRLALYCPEFCSRQLHDPIFVVGFNNGGKSRLVSLLEKELVACTYPDEGNAEFWFRGYFPWAEKRPDFGPIWSDPDKFISKILPMHSDSFMRSRAYLGAYQWLMGTQNIINDSGMLGAISPDMFSSFPNAKFVHVIRDGRVASYLSAKREWCNIMRIPEVYQSRNCPIKFQDVLSKMINYWAWTVNRVQSIKAIAPDKVYEIRYEEWCKDPTQIFHELVSFMGIESKSSTDLSKLNLTNMNQLIHEEFTLQDLTTMSESAGKTLAQLGYI